MGEIRRTAAKNMVRLETWNRLPPVDTLYHGEAAGHARQRASPKAGTLIK
jgi:hypothetical protein